MISITPRIQAQYTFTANEKKVIKDDKYSDPLMNWPIRGLAYTNELGAALSEIAPKTGTLLWIPALLYFGADIYDKYKNEKISYNPNAQRGTEQAIFQLLASVILPTASVLIGQKTASILGASGKTGLTLDTQEEIIKFMQGFTGRRKIDEYTNNIDEFKNKFHESLKIKREKLIRENKIKNPIKFIGEYIFEKNHPESIAMSQEDKVTKFADRHIDEMFSIYSDLIVGKKPKEFSNKMWNKFNKLKDKFIKDPDYKTTYIKDAAEDIIRRYQKSKIQNTKILKTIGGFVALGLAIKPIDKFVENVIIRKVVEPNLSNVFPQKNLLG